MRKFGFFALSFSVSVVLFVALSVLVLVLSGIGGNNGDSAAQNEDRIRLSVDSTDYEVQILTVFYDGVSAETELSAEAPLFAVCTFKSDTKQLTAVPVELDSRLLSEVTELLENGMIYSAVDAVCREKEILSQKFIKFDSENFAKIGDRMNGIVYNEDDKPRLLTGDQAVERMNSTLFADACSQFWATAALKDTEAEFKYVADNTVNNLSYIEAYGQVF